MKKEVFAKIAGVVPFITFLLANQIWEFTWEVKIGILVGIIILGCVSLLLRPKRKNKGMSYLMLGAGLISAIALFCIQYFSI